jgi:malate dehydrogenase (oxaloacetate-decarboxylating)
MLDVGTNNAGLLHDPLYLGVREPRLQDEEYMEFMEEFVDAVFTTYPDVLLQWEDFSRQKAWSVLEQFRDRTCSFNDDIQGTGAVTYAGILAACKLTETSIAEQTFCVYGAGAGGGGIIEVIVSALEKAGLSESDARRRVVALDSRGLILTDRQRLESFKRIFAREPELASGWELSDSHKIGLLDTVRNFQPTVLIGTSGQPGTFTEAIVREMAGYADRPAIFALSNPTSKTEVLPENVFKWTDGRGLIATGSPFPPVFYKGTAYGIGQGNNAFCFPGIGLGVYASGATRVTRQMLLAAGEAVAEHVSEEQLAQGQLYPSVEDLRPVSRSVALAVGLAARDSGVVPEGITKTLTAEIMAEKVDEKTWYPEYVSYRRVE